MLTVWNQHSATSLGDSASPPMSRMAHADKITSFSVNNLHSDPTNMNNMNKQKKLYKD